MVALGVDVDGLAAQIVGKFKNRIARRFYRLKLRKMRFIHSCDNAKVRTHHLRKFLNISAIIFTELKYQYFFIPLQSLHESRNTDRRIFTSSWGGDSFTFR